MTALNNCPRSVFSKHPWPAARLRPPQPKATSTGVNAQHPLSMLCPQVFHSGLESYRLTQLWRFVWLFFLFKCFISFLLGSVPYLFWETCDLSVFLIGRCHFSMATYLDVLNRESVKSVSLWRPKQLEWEAAQGAWYPSLAAPPLGKGPQAE